MLKAKGETKPLSINHLYGMPFNEDFTEDQLNVMKETADMISASRHYEANVNAFNTTNGKFCFYNGFG